MTIFASEAIDPINATPEQLVADLEEFKAICQPVLGSLVRQIQSAKSYHTSPLGISQTRATSFIFSHQLDKLFARPIQAKDLNDLMPTAFYLRFFVMVYRRLDGDSQRSFLSKFVNVIADQDQTLSLFFELYTGAVFVHKKCDVTFNDLLPGQTSTHDITVRKGLLELHVEAKSVHVDAGRPISAEICRSGLKLLIDELVAFPHGDHSAVAWYKGPRAPKHGPVLASLKGVIASSGFKVGTFANMEWSLTVKHLEADQGVHMRDEYHRTMGIAAGQVQYGYQMAFIDAIETGVNLAGLSWDGDWRITGVLDSNIRDALRQMPQDQLKIVWVQVVGLMHIGQLDIDANFALLHRDAKLKRLFEEKQATDAHRQLAGFDFVTDPIAQWFPQENVWGLHSQHSSFRETANFSSSNLYDFAFGRVLPSAQHERIETAVQKVLAQQVAMGETTVGQNPPAT